MQNTCSIIIFFRQKKNPALIYEKADVSVGLHQRRSDILFLQILGIARFDFAFGACEQAMDIFLVAQNYKESGNHGKIT